MSIPQVGDWVIIIYDYIGLGIWRELGVIEKYVGNHRFIVPCIRLCDGFQIWGDECLWWHYDVKLKTDIWDVVPSL